MGVTELNSVKPDMVLAKPVHSHSGVLLLKEGKSLKEKDLLLLEAWGVKEVDIEGIDVAQSQEQALSQILSKEEISALDAELDKKFSNQPESEITTEIKKAMRRIKIEEIVEARRQQNG